MSEGVSFRSMQTLGECEVKSIYSGPYMRGWGLSWDLAVWRDGETRRQKSPQSRLCSVQEWLLYCREVESVEVASLFLDPFSGWWRPGGFQGEAWFSEDLVRVAHRNVLKENSDWGPAGSFVAKGVSILWRPLLACPSLAWTRMKPAPARMSLCLPLQVQGRTRDHTGGHRASWHLNNLLGL